MKRLILLVLVAVAVARPNDFYDTKYNNFDIDEMTSNVRLWKAHVDCILDKGKCTPEGNDFKKLMPEAIASSCGKCTEKQKALITKAIHAIRTKLPTEYKALIDKDDPKGKRTAELGAFVAKYKS